MFKKFLMAAAIFMTSSMIVSTASAEEVTVYYDGETQYCVDDQTIEYTCSDIAFKVKVVSYYRTYSPQENWYFFEEEEDGTTAYVIGEGGMAHTVKRADEPAYSVYKFCLKHLN